MSRYPDADLGIDEGDDELPYDDPIARTRMAWLRTMLIVAVVGALLWRAAYVEGQEWWALGWFVPSVVILGIGFVRMAELARKDAAKARQPGAAPVGLRSLAPLAWTLAGFLALAGAGALLAAV
jgi:hypothetical protein